MIGFQPGMENSYYAATIIDHQVDEVVVQYETLIDDYGGPLLDQFAVENIRPYPATVVADFDNGDQIDVWFDGAWWRATYEQPEPDDQEDLLHSVYLEFMPEDQQIHQFPTDQIRLHQDFLFDNPTNFFGIWFYQRASQME